MSTPLLATAGSVGVIREKLATPVLDSLDFDPDDFSAKGEGEWEDYKNESGTVDSKSLTNPGIMITCTVRIVESKSNPFIGAWYLCKGVEGTDDWAGSWLLVTECEATKVIKGGSKPVEYKVSFQWTQPMQTWAVATPPTDRDAD